VEIRQVEKDWRVHETAPTTKTAAQVGRPFRQSRMEKPVSEENADESVTSVIHHPKDRTG
jgi:hypothetical protein